MPSLQVTRSTPLASGLCPSLGRLNTPLLPWGGALWGNRVPREVGTAWWGQMNQRRPSSGQDPGQHVSTGRWPGDWPFPAKRVRPQMVPLLTSQQRP